MQPQELIKLVGENIRRRRLELRLTQQELGDRLDVTQTYISDVEQGKCSPRLGRMARIAEALEVAPSYLLAGHTVAAI